MATLYLASDEGPIVITRSADRWQAKRPIDAPLASCVAADPLRPERVIFGTTGHGIWRSDNAGADWQRVFEGVPHARITSLAVSPVERVDGYGVVYVGTEPSAIFRSDDGGVHWRQYPGLTDVPSADTWSFPPRPLTHHARWIEPDPHEAGWLYVAIEAGALLRSPDSGQSWLDRVPDGPYDTHELRTHPMAPRRLWSAAGDGFFESDDAGETWRCVEDGLRFAYCWSLALDPVDPTTMVMSAAPGPRQAHDAERAESAIYRRSGTGQWQEVHAGLPESKGMRAAAIAAHPGAPGTFYCVAEAEAYSSSDDGATWERLNCDWPTGQGRPRCHALTVAGIE